MSANTVLVAIRDSLSEASTELTTKLGDLAAQLEEFGADPALLAEVTALATSLADIVPNVVAEDPAVELPPVEEPTE